MRKRKKNLGNERQEYRWKGKIDLCNERKYLWRKSSKLVKGYSDRRNKPERYTDRKRCGNKNKDGDTNPSDYNVNSVWIPLEKRNISNGRLINWF